MDIYTYSPSARGAAGSSESIPSHGNSFVRRESYLYIHYIYIHIHIHIYIYIYIDTHMDIYTYSPSARGAAGSSECTPSHGSCFVRRESYLYIHYIYIYTYTYI